jgi:3alpha(or 20beta)-hydroxysteroid dehydrogenase
MSDDRAGRLAGKVVLVTGGASGIGAATVASCEREGAEVIVADVTLADDGPKRRHLDVADETSWAALTGSIARSHGRLDALINCAGILRTAPIEEQRADVFMEVVRVNQLGSFLAIREAIPLMREKGGSVALLSSLAGLSGSAHSIAYTSTKWAVRGMAKVAANELKPFGIRVNSVHPGVTVTPMVAGWGDPSTQIDPETVAAMLLFLASDESIASTGSEFICDGGQMIP